MPELSIKPYTNLEDKHFSNEVRILLTDNDFNGINFKEGQIPLFVSKCFFKKILITNIEEIAFQDVSLMFSDCYIEDFQIEAITSGNISLLFFNCIINGKIDNSKLKLVEFNNCCLISSMFLLNIETVTIKFSEKFNELFNQEHFKNHIKDSEKLSEIRQSYYINHCKKIWVSSEIKNHNPKWNINLSLTYLSEDNDISTNVKNIRLQALSFTGNTCGKLTVENSKIERLYLREFSPKGETVFYDISPSTLLNPKASTEQETKIEIHRCNLDSVDFDNIKFDAYNIVSFYRTKFSKTTFTSCNFPKNYVSFERFKSLENVHYKDVLSGNYHKDQYEIFLQLKKSLELTGNYYEAQKLQGIAHDALKQIKTISSWDRMILKINSFSNNHGLSIIRPFLLFLAFTIPLYILYLWSLGRINNNSIDYTLFGSYFSFIDLTHRTDFLVNKDGFTGLSLALDFINKIVAGFFIYQLIAAFRKYGKN